MALSKAESALERIKDAARRKAKRTDEEKTAMYSAIARKGALLVTTVGLAIAKRYNVRDKLGPVPWKPVVGLVLTGGELMTAGGMPMTSAVVGGMSDAFSTVYLDRAIGTRSIVAGNGNALPQGSVTPIRQGSL